MLEIIPIDTPSLGDRSYLAHDGEVALVVDPQRDLDRLLALAEQHGVRITHVFETHVHNDDVSGGLALAKATDAAYHVNADDPVSFARVPVRDGDAIQVADTMRVLVTPGHTFTNLAYVLEADGAPVGVFTGGWLLYGSTGRPDLLGPGHTPMLVHRQFDSARRLASLRDLAAAPGDGRVVVLDVRRRLEWSEGHIADAVHIPLHELPRQLGDVPAGQVWVVCRSGYRATVGASLLAAHGRDVVAVDDEFGNAAAAGLPLGQPVASRPNDDTGEVRERSGPGRAEGLRQPAARDAPSGEGAQATPHDALPAWRRVLAVVAHPDDESFGLGGLLDAFHGAGAETTVLCLTQGEASTLRGVPGDLREVRAAELRDAAALVGVAHVEQRDHPDGHLTAVPMEVLAGEVAAAARAGRVDGLLVFDTNGVTGHQDHAAATAAALYAARSLDLRVLGWIIPISVAEALNAEFGTHFTGRQPSEIHLTVRVDRTRQRRAAHAHPSQALPTSALWRRLELLGDAEQLRWLRNPTPAAPPEEESGQS